MVGGMHTSGYLLVWTIHYLTLNEDVYHKLVEEMKERVGSDQGDKLKKYAYEPDTYVDFKYVVCKSIRVVTSYTYAHTQTQLYVVHAYIYNLCIQNM